MIFCCKIILKNSANVFNPMTVMCQNYGNCFNDFVFIYFCLKSNLNCCRFHMINCIRRRPQKIATAYPSSLWKQNRQKPVACDDAGYYHPFNFPLQVFHVQRDISNDQSKSQRQSQNYKQGTELTILLGFSHFLFIKQIFITSN